MDETRFLTNEYSHQAIDVGNAHEKNYYHISAPGFIQDLAIGFSNGYTGHTDAKWEIIAGGRRGTEFVIRKGNCCVPILARHRNEDRTQWEQVRDNLAVQVTDGNIAIYSANSDGTKADLLVELNDDTIVKSDLNTLTMTGGYGGSGFVRIRSICESQTES